MNDEVETISSILINNESEKKMNDSFNQSESADNIEAQNLNENKKDDERKKDEKIDVKMIASKSDGEKIDDEDSNHLANTNRDRHRKRKSRHRRAHQNKWRRRWRPYYRSLTTDERQTTANTSESNSKQLSIEEKRARWLMLRMQYGKPVAPYNTTQFLMDDHNVREPDFEEISRLLHRNHHEHHHQQQQTSQQQQTPRRRCNSDSANPDLNESLITSSDEYYSSPDDEQDFMQKQFSEAYEIIHSERLNSMSKSELVQEYLTLEEKIDDLEKQLTEMKKKLTSTAAAAVSSSPFPTTITSRLLLQSNNSNKTIEQTNTVQNSDSKDELCINSNLNEKNLSISDYISMKRKLEDEIEHLKLENKRLMISNEKLQSSIKNGEQINEFKSKCDLIKKSLTSCTLKLKPVPAEEMMDIIETSSLVMTKMITAIPVNKDEQDKQEKLEETMNAMPM